ncbi:FUSC family protein, partial [Cellulomonas bogoriensis]|uniref:FUSC family protein n=1 Tax=Cellulomonas bogoriensis TaxID=301388 RepID=UPI0005525E73
MGAAWAFVQAAAHRVRLHGPSLLLASASAGVAYALAGWAFGPENAFFAPIAAVVCVSITAGQRVRRAVEIAVGVVVGLVAADLLLRWTGAGPWQLALAVL